ncbi:hypothetical protein OF83DRAFT_432552 [Amylostereum chailletii]|nr:hypothetical protein OF83DRAFT_432552 [Amylostereum chailletii]
MPCCMAASPVLVLAGFSWSIIWNETIHRVLEPCHSIVSTEVLCFPDQVGAQVSHARGNFVEPSESASTRPPCLSYRFTILHHLFSDVDHTKLTLRANIYPCGARMFGICFRCSVFWVHSSRHRDSRVLCMYSAIGATAF